MNIDKKSLKRKTIAQSCCSILEENQFHNISISKLAQTAGIGKGTIYEYFENKEDIVFELMSCMQETYDKKLQSKLSKLNNALDKTIAVFDLFISDDKIIRTQREIYKQFLIVSLSNPANNIKLYNDNIRNKYISILKNITSSKDLSKEIFDDVIGKFVISNTLSDYNLSQNVREYLTKQIKLINK